MLPMNIYQTMWQHILEDCNLNIQHCDILKYHAGYSTLYLLSRGQSSRLQIQRSGFDSRRYQIFWEVVGLEWGPLSLVSTIEELLGRNSSGSGLENREYSRGYPLHWPHYTLYLQKLALTSLTSCCHSVSIVCSRTTELFLSIQNRSQNCKPLEQLWCK
jgi:hypothetical protein